MYYIIYRNSSKHCLLNNKITTTIIIILIPISNTFCLMRKGKKSVLFRLKRHAQYEFSCWSIMVYMVWWCRKSQEPNFFPKILEQRLVEWRGQVGMFHRFFRRDDCVFKSVFVCFLRSWTSPSVTGLWFCQLIFLKLQHWFFLFFIIILSCNLSPSHQRSSELLRGSIYQTHTRFSSLPSHTYKTPSAYTPLMSWFMLCMQEWLTHTHSQCFSRQQQESRRWGF